MKVNTDQVLGYAGTIMGSAIGLMLRCGVTRDQIREQIEYAFTAYDMAAGGELPEFAEVAEKFTKKVIENAQKTGEGSADVSPR